MGKVKLTQEQADAIEIIKENKPTKLEADIRTQLYKHWVSDKFKCLNSLSLDDFLSALYADAGYEVEPEFKVGDWVHVMGIFRDRSPEVARVTEVSVDRIVLDNGFDLGRGSITPDRVRHATPEEIAEEKERRWWKKHGREVWEIRKDDLLMPGNSAVAFAVRAVHGDRVEMRNGGVEMLERIKKQYKVSCFAEDRKDINQ